MTEGKRFSLRGIINSITTTSYDQPHSRKEVEETYDMFSTGVHVVNKALSLPEVLDLTPEEVSLFEKQLKSEAASKILTDPFFVDPLSGEKVNVKPDHKETWLRRYNKHTPSTDLSDSARIMRDGEVKAAAKTVVRELFTPEHAEYGSILLRSLTQEKYTPPSVDQLQTSSPKHVELLKNDLALQNHAAKISEYRSTLRSPQLS